MENNLQNSTVEFDNVKNMVTIRRSINDDYGWQKIIETRKSGQTVGDIDTYVVPPKWAPVLPKPFEKFRCLRSYSELMLYINKHSLFDKIDPSIIHYQRIYPSDKPRGNKRPRTKQYMEFIETKGCPEKIPKWFPSPDFSLLSPTVRKKNHRRMPNLKSVDRVTYSPINYNNNNGTGQIVKQPNHTANNFTEQYWHSFHKIVRELFGHSPQDMK